MIVYTETQLRAKVCTRKTFFCLFFPDKFLRFDRCRRHDSANSWTLEPTQNLLVGAPLSPKTSPLPTYLLFLPLQVHHRFSVLANLNALLFAEQWNCRSAVEGLENKQDVICRDSPKRHHHPPSFYHPPPPSLCFRVQVST